MLTLHHLEQSQSFRILWLLEELGADYELKVYPRDSRTQMAPRELKQISPLGTAPVITEGDLVLAESNAITDYILDRHDNGDRLRPQPGTPHRDRYLFWLHAAQGSFMPIMLFGVVFGVMRKRAPFFAKPFTSPLIGAAERSFLKPRLDKILDLAEEDLAKAPWFSGDAIGAADFAVSFPMEAARLRGDLRQRRHCTEWAMRIASTPSFQAAKRKDGNRSMIPSL